MLRICTLRDFDAIHSVINSAATAYENVIPDDCYHRPYMAEEELRREMKRMAFYGWEETGELVGVMGLEAVKGISLVRHAYVLPERQRNGIGRKLLDHAKRTFSGDRLLVGTWADAHWAIDFYEKHGFRICPDKDLLLKTYWDVPERQIETSVVLEMVR